MFEPERRRLAELAAAGLRRELREVSSPAGPVVTLGGREVVCLCSNNYLDLAGDPRVRAAARAAIERWGWGPGASRLISGTTSAHCALERRLAGLVGTEAALLFGSGYAANAGAIAAAAGPGDLIFIDKLVHASIIDAARASGATLRVFGHRNYDRLEALLIRSGDTNRRLIVTDSLFSMDGDAADLPRLVELKQRYDARLMVDEAHAIGVMGEAGRGVAELQGTIGQIDILVGTLSKALGGVGGFVAAGGEFIDLLINTARGFIFSTALPSAACEAAAAALELVEREPHRRQRLRATAERLRDELRQRGLDVGESCSQIVPVMLGSPPRAVALSEALLARGYWTPAIRPPSVPRGRSRLRISLTAGHTDAHVDGLLVALDAARTTE